ncbi:hypothetical protein FHS31_001783 [Sphingomonas vulcanisoli]|uniref:Uncharacterized protein n=1 Tax=Sphingomonas vulcanisoli TaxID=1658060 RepID=A0ABX0TRT4_9SPHN|nr:hypothetical protein [Sphingomonas vulcanisoli]NIJ08166.1 hypothetical protein [Sphingomonas vulcanisoli]
MRRRDLGWRLLGLVSYAAGIACALAARPEGSQIGAILVIDGIALAIIGIVLMAKGRKAPLALRIERSPHRHLPGAIHHARIARRRPQ